MHLRSSASVYERTVDSTRASPCPGLGRGSSSPAWEPHQRVMSDRAQGMISLAVFRPHRVRTYQTLKSGGYYDATACSHTVVVGTHGAHAERSGFSADLESTERKFGNQSAERLLGGNENPPVISDGSGRFRARVSEDRIGFTLRYDVASEDSDVTQAHLHIQNPGNNGGIVVFLCSGIPGQLNPRRR
jgi:hypothetical protein